jgi:hypothetical protein
VKKIALVILLALPLALAGCSSKSILQGGTSLTASIQNPAGKRELAAIEGAYGAALVVAVNYRRFCYQTATPSSVCKDRRKVVLAMQAADRNAHGAIVAARRFVRENPTLSAVSVIGAARAAVADFQSIANANKVN